MVAASLYENAVPEDSIDETNDAFQPLSIDDYQAKITDAIERWGEDTTPIAWLFRKEGRGKLVSFAVRALRGSEDEYYMNQSDLARESDVSRHSVHRHIDDLVALNIYEVKPGKIERYRPNADSRILKAVAAANDAIASQRDSLSL